jgi:hypothetical protein
VGEIFVAKALLRMTAAGGRLVFWWRCALGVLVMRESQKARAKRPRERKGDNGVFFGTAEAVP